MTATEDIQKLITLNTRRLQKLREQQATFGFSTSPEVLMEIENIEGRLKQLQTGLEAEQAALTRQSERGEPVAEALTQVTQQLAEIKTLLAERPGGVNMGNVYGNIIGANIAGGSITQQSGMKLGGIRAKKIEADTVVDGVLVDGGDAETARAFLDAAKNLQTGGITATETLKAKTVVSGFHYIGREAGQPTIEQFQQELAELRKQLTAAVNAGEIANPDDAEDAKTAVDRAEKQANSDAPDKGRLVNQLEKLSGILTKAGEAAVAARNFGLGIIKLAPVAAALKHFAEMLF